jgi:hypothetical protein
MSSSGLGRGLYSTAMSSRPFTSDSCIAVDRPSLIDSVASGMRAAEGAGQRHRQHARQARRQADRHAPGQRAAHPAQLLAGALHLVQDAAPVGQQQAPGLCLRSTAHPRKLK